MHAIFPPVLSMKSLGWSLSPFAGVPGLGDLSCWAAQGVFLLNTVLTVRAASANSHANKGWETFTDATIKFISDNTRDVVFLLWGKPAQKKTSLISNSKHLVLTTVHPSPLSGKTCIYSHPSTFS
jgi:uracil-DNA glycosylase